MLLQSNSAQHPNSYPQPTGNQYVNPAGITYWNTYQSGQPYTYQSGQPYVHPIVFPAGNQNVYPCGYTEYPDVYNRYNNSSWLGSGVSKRPPVDWDSQAAVETCGAFVLL